MGIDRAEALAEYASRAAASGEKLVRRYVRRSDKLAASTSSAAQSAFVAAMSDPKVLTRRQSMLKKLSESDLNAAMEASGASAYSTAVNAKSPKWASRVEPYLAAIENIHASLKPRTRDPAANVANRVTPFATGLRAKKDAMG